MEEAPHAPPVGAGAAPPPNPPPRPASGSHRFPNTLSQVGEQYGPSIAPFARARCPFSPLLRPYSSGGAARGSHAGQFSCFGPRSCFIAFVLDIPNGVCPLDRAVGRAYIRDIVPIRKCHQMPSKKHIRWGLSTFPGRPAAGRCGRVVPVPVLPPLLLCTRPARARPSIGDWGSKPPSRSALAPLGSSPGPVLSPVTALQFQPACS
jgi:hypothetical protein